VEVAVLALLVALVVPAVAVALEQLVVLAGLEVRAVQGLLVVQVVLEP
jgi:hypothetical protein